MKDHAFKLHKVVPAKGTFFVEAYKLCGSCASKNPKLEPETIFISVKDWNALIRLTD